MRRRCRGADLRLQPVDLEDLAARAASIARRWPPPPGEPGPAPRGILRPCLGPRRPRSPAQVLDTCWTTRCATVPRAARCRSSLEQWAVSGVSGSAIRAGIPAGHLPLIFERFYRADASRDRRGNQAGLGLAIARALIVAQGGRISAECPADGGTLLRFALPSSRLPRNRLRSDTHLTRGVTSLRHPLSGVRHATGTSTPQRCARRGAGFPA